MKVRFVQYCLIMYDSLNKCFTKPSGCVWSELIGHTKQTFGILVGRTYSPLHTVCYIFDDFCWIGSGSWMDLFKNGLMN